MEEEEGKYGLLPVMSGAVSERILEEMTQFGKLSEDAKRDTLGADLEQLGQGNPELRDAVEGLAIGTLEAVESIPGKITHLEWEQLRSGLIYAVLVVLRALNEARREQIG